MILVTGGDRSGKSAFAENLAKKTEGKVLYIATAKIMDKEMENRIQKHKQRRPQQWDTLESYIHLGEKIKNAQKKYHCILLDCITMLLTNLIFEYSKTDDIENMDFIELENKIVKELEEIAEVCSISKSEVIIVTGEIGLGIVPMDKLSRHFRDIIGSVNQILAQKANEVYFVVSGIAMKIKG
ncbi:bifunctional adenosylcobinamide kinase/adenosylcobinamide-phosphate guanylyltransferase [Clostridium sp. MD294]|uniref:bifunctional adenosylcobinamide kinase/adenosylcobinamide-phosphate guanylyltransferase n=1 Tax=Clostridium sp. MD294 TaxID=97138 RepID=UPI0002CC60AF|nr:bifunctional adenosylcobinamide kinase/adenosylcobinamide-phosphate guanylyltransferase [Clostridium sp. MD294]NDO45806.1 bifunctional adenosylcobinamide kinase/adenosylcobinamide-phosphate guanylyltransferase [Clostridium sp. MD294]USF30539.1 Bifunctional adenosylcobalamin biosynthesis protein CobU [Clostridium sp. MD294]